MDIGQIVSVLGIIVVASLGVFMANSRSSSIKIKIITYLWGAAGIAMILGGHMWLSKYFSDAYTISKIIYFEGKGGKRLLVFNEGGNDYLSTSLRLSVLNPDTGERLAKEAIGTGAFDSHDNTTLVALTDDKMWLSDFDRGIHARDPYTGELVLTRELIAKKYPTLDPSKNARSAPAVEVKTADGYVFAARPPDFVLELKSFPVYQFNSTDTLFHSLPESKGTRGCRLIGGKNAICLDQDSKIDDDRAVTVLKSGLRTTYSQGDGVNMSERLNQNLKLRNAFFIDDSKLYNPKSLLIGHTEVDKEYYNQFELTRFDMKGRLIWTFKTGTDTKPGQISLHNGMIYLTIKGRLLAYDAKTGTKKWETQL